MIPLLHDLADETVLVFGGGPVGARKARTFGHEADVVVCSPRFDGGDFGGAALVRARPDGDAVAGWLERVDPALVVAATDDGDLNATIAGLARGQGRLVNRADVSGDRPPKDVAVPAIARDDPVVVGVGTDGNPAVSVHLRDRIEETIAGAGAMAELTAGLREALADAPADRRHEALRAVVASDAVWTALDSPGSNARQVAWTVIEDATGDTP